VTEREGGDACRLFAAEYGGENSII